MFTGIIRGRFPVVSIEKKQGLHTFTINLNTTLVEGLTLGASVSVSGVCLTVTKIDETKVYFDAMQETLDKTTLGKVSMSDVVNIERSFSVGDEVGGHIVSGHVYGMAEIINIEKSEHNCVVTFKCPPFWMKYILDKGFVGLDGCSLTIVDPDSDAGTFKVWFIPETLSLTTFGTKGVGDFVNLELDSKTQTIVETVERVLVEKGALS
ncbi:MAG: riboflavin synthase subunit alpha [Candidatus Magasanikbacteria bacterium]|jgi:riboflavin synthase|nr:riboflavin synthase subunit alpha [Candidatus Magasanikbacteria bacterium]MBT4221018.1 riboflavin synthase subunit alpha [Candidatus Magasanikbacteria bacterium]MBT4350536.1 riboflavin synthase subunit alpha [Candidatus Magasanikbacteria bacterium]MBT4541911.1 riboflavin synthase subunit alpha [Candidatus Magasanikbacteria bacterium]MBT6253042.1 riboflavin synthase subunit alpha [Candidatus Magasanikbacteria bacterium]